MNVAATKIAMAILLVMYGAGDVHVAGAAASRGGAETGLQGNDGAVIVASDTAGVVHPASLQSRNLAQSMIKTPALRISGDGCPALDCGSSNVPAGCRCINGCGNCVPGLFCGVSCPTIGGNQGDTCMCG